MDTTSDRRSDAAPDPGAKPEMPKPGGCERCSYFAVSGLRELAALILDGHHAHCPSGLGRGLGPEKSSADWNIRATADYGLISDLVSRLASAESERDRLAAENIALADVLREVSCRLDYLRNLWGDEGITRRLSDRIAEALAGLPSESKGGEGGDAG